MLKGCTGSISECQSCCSSCCTPSPCSPTVICRPSCPPRCPPKPTRTTCPIAVHLARGPFLRQRDNTVDIIILGIH
ncbi:uncharacterized protein LOC117601187 isoform X2 [Osmia lignaria lignaria]|uniref:uncharacterized protein LOC117601187 isoform X2 n=1 Tax=Osmia lignaria lignaria TaxID=1437193 RepID=UPI0014790D34|nr:late cornified envelope-like proline-rich protein 1 isoform X2 [Osmia lignaria]